MEGLVVMQATPRLSRLGVRARATVVAIVVGLLASAPVSAATSVSVSDPIGDVDFRAPSFMDLVEAQVTGDGASFDLRVEVAGTIPSAPGLPRPATKEIWWSFAFNTDPASAPQGDPFPATPAVPAPAEFLASVIWDGTSFRARLLDRRPLLSGGDAVSTPLAFEVAGSEVTMSVDASLLGDPGAFLWTSATLYWASPPGATTGWMAVDRLNSGYVAWP